MNPLLTEFADVAIIAPIVPRSVPRPPVRPTVLPQLAPTSVAPDRVSGECLVTTARLDGSGRFRAARLLRALGWTPGRRLTMRVNGSITTARPDPTGTECITPRGLIVLPMPVRRFTGLEMTMTIVAIAIPADHVMIIAPAHTVVATMTVRSEVSDDC